MLGDLLEEGIVVKQADDLYGGANTPEQLVVNFTRALAYKCSESVISSNTWLLIIACPTWGSYRWYGLEGSHIVVWWTSSSIPTCPTSSIGQQNHLYTPSKGHSLDNNTGALHNPGIRATFYVSREDNIFQLKTAKVQSVLVALWNRPFVSRNCSQTLQPNHCQITGTLLCSHRQ